MASLENVWEDNSVQRWMGNSISLAEMINGVGKCLHPNSFSMNRLEMLNSSCFQVKVKYVLYF